MKKLKLLIVLILLISTFVGCSIEFGVEERETAEIIEEEMVIELTDINKTTPIEGIDMINVSTENVYTTISNHDEDYISIKGEFGEFTKDIEVIKNGNEIIINEEVIGKSNSGNDIWDETVGHIEILIPRQYNKALNVNFEAGLSNIVDFSVENLKVNTGEGSVNISMDKYKKIELVAGSGHVRMHHNQVNSGELDVKGGSGRLELFLDTIGGNLKFEGGTGFSVIKIEPYAKVKINTTKGSGKCDVQANPTSDYKYIFDINAGDGKVIIKDY